MKKDKPDQVNKSRAILASGMGREPYISDLDVLVRKCKSGDSTSWHSLVEHFQGLVWSTINRVGLKNEDAEDTFQKVFLILYKNLDRIESAPALPKWLATTAAREAIRLYRQNRDKAVIALEEFESYDQLLVSEDASIEEVTVATMQAHELRAIMNSLPGKCPQLLALLYSDQDSSYDEIKSQLGIPIGSIGPTRARCIERLRKALINANFFESESNLE